MPSVGGLLTALPARRGFVTHIRAGLLAWAAFQGVGGNKPGAPSRACTSVFALTHDDLRSLLSRIINC
jgi:hypothetical protein